MKVINTSLMFAVLLPLLLRISVLTRDIDIAILSVCPSVCPSVTFWYSMKTNIVCFFYHTVAQSFLFYAY